MKWLVRLPLLVRTPLLAAVLIFAVAMLITQIAVFNLSKQYEHLTEKVGQVYLDGLSASVLTAYEHKDIPSIHRALRQALDFYLGIVDRQLVLIDQNDGILAHVSGPNIPLKTSPPTTLFKKIKGSVYEPETQSIWVWRELGSTGIIAANLDVSSFANERTKLQWRLLLISALMSLLLALGGYLAIRRIQRPLKTLSQHLSQAVAFGPQKIPETNIPQNDAETQALMHAYNRMTEAVQDREQLSELLAQQDRQALLGRIAATLAHEIRNPLTGIMTALQTIRMYGDDSSNRNQALDFIDRGIKALQGVAEATLNAYRPNASAPNLTAQDLYDVLLLVQPHAHRKQVVLNQRISPQLSLSLDAFKIRQIVLNLLLNAIQASSKGKTVTLQTYLSSHSFSLTVTDQGNGLPPKIKQLLVGQSTSYPSRSLGLEIVRRLTQEMGGIITVDSEEGKGTAIELSFPLTEQQHHETRKH